MKKLIFAVLFLFSLAACTSEFEKENQNPYTLSDEMLTQDNNLLGSPFSSLMFNLFGHQIEENLIHDSFTRQLATPTPFAGGVNNTTYYIRWNTYWDRVYGSVMSPSSTVIDNAKKYNLPMFTTWAKLVRILSMSKLTAYHGPVIYSNYGTTKNSTIMYDKESDLYNLFFAQLDTIQSTFNANKDYKGFKKFDASYGGDLTKWMKLVNSLRLRLAIRISKVAPAVAKTQGEKAMSDPAGLITTNGDNFSVSLNGNILPIAMICFQWDDTRMDAGMESFLIGLKDNRISSFFQPATDNTLYPEHPAYPYKGIRSGAYLDSKDQRLA
ncbi:MAG: SusD/RagB family nutrient-binding outer membrane lipoprotein, partial [Bacteroidota bacterium]|nr:SusD/RagB family nutrient-binding outer membrane lipoprotein [Bacteroidota bacterium]